MPTPLNRLPWDIVQDQFGIEGADFTLTFDQQTHGNGLHPAGG